jgi:putative redox protein
MGETDNGHAIIMEASASKTSAGPSPLEVLLMGMGACASSDVVSLLKKQIRTLII